MIIITNNIITMPLYEMFLITKCATPEHLATLAANISRNIWKNGGVVREVKILSDRYAHGL